MADDAGPPPPVADDPPPEASAKRKQQPQREGGGGGFLSRLRGVFGGGGDDFEKRLRDLTKEEVSVHSRMKRRALSSRKTSRNIIVLSVALEVVAVAHAIMTTRSVDLNWQMRAVRVLPMFLLPGISFVIYTALVSITRMLYRKDQKNLERLRAERQAKIDELKERTNYYSTQQLIQRYDLDPAAKAAAATVLASKLGADSGLQVYLGDEANINSSSGKSNDVELVQSSGIRNRKTSHSRSPSTGNAAMTQFIDETSNEYFGVDSQEGAAQNQRVAEGKGPSDGGWFARIAALLVGEDPTQCYALICSSCHMHNGLARKEDFPYITYYCPHCRALNGSRQLDEHGAGLSSGMDAPTTPGSGSNASYNASNLATVAERSPEIDDEPSSG